MKAQVILLFAIYFILLSILTIVAPKTISELNTFQGILFILSLSISSILVVISGFFPKD